MRKFIGFALFVISIFLGAYVGAFVMLILPIVECCKAFDAGTLTGLMVGTTVIKCLFSGSVATIIIYAGAIAAKLIGK